MFKEKNYVKFVIFFIALILVCLFPVISFSQELSAGSSGKELTLSEEGNVSLDFRDADIKNVLEILSLKSGVNIVTGPEVTGLVSIQLKEVPWKEALDVILRTYGYASERKGNIIVVTTVEELKKRREDALLLEEQEPLETRIFTLNFAIASDVLSSVEKMKTERGSINIDSRTNTLIVTDIATRIEAIENVMLKLDSTTPQVMIEAKIVETNFVDEENFGVNWIIQASATGSSRGISYPFKLGATDNPFGGTVAAPTAFSYGTLSFAQMSSAMEILKSKTNTNILSNPRLVTLDNETASINIGQQYPIPSYVFNKETGSLEINGFEYKDIGINFQVTPHVNSAGFVTLEVIPEISEKVNDVPFGGETLPLISNESTKTKVMIKDGDTLVIAGLIKSKENDVTKKVPILGDVPILGYIFKKKEKEVNKTDLLIFVTPHIITPVLE